MINPTSATYLGIPGIAIFVVVLLAALGCFCYIIYLRFRLLALGKWEPLRLDHLVQRVWGTIYYAFLQRKMFKEPIAGIMHALIFWGFLAVALNTTHMVIRGFVEGFSFLPGFLETPYNHFKDAFEILVIVGILIAFYKRGIQKPERMTYSWEAWLILIFIFILMVTDFAINGVEAANGKQGLGFMGILMGQAFEGLDIETLRAIHYPSWWLHIVVLFAFLNMLPLSKHFHVITSIPNVFFRTLDSTGTIKPLNLEDESATTFGVSKIEEFTWKAIFDAYTCTECGRCQDQCPAHATSKPLSPRNLIIDIRDNAYQRVPLFKRQVPGNGGSSEGGEQPKEQPKLSPLVVEGKEYPPASGGHTGHNGTIISETFWSCLNCGACQEACPVFIEHVPKIIDVRRYLVLMESKFPEECITTFKNIETNYNPWGLSYETRDAWAEGLDIKRVKEGEPPKLLFWVGCAGAFDERQKKVTIANAKLLKAAGVDFTILGNEEKCNGDPVRRIGNEYLYQTLCKENIETLKKYGVTRILTQCPHCYHTLKNEYPQFGGNFEVYHHTQFLSGLLREGKLTLTKVTKMRVTYHDSCFLGRHNKVFSEPREILRALKGAEVVEMGRRREKGFCCGAGGGRMWMDEKIGTRVNRNRTAEALALNPDAIATACPFCMTMLDDGVKDANKEETVKVLDLAELLSRSL